MYIHNTQYEGDIFIACFSLGKEALDIVIAKVMEGLEGVEKQAENTEKYSAMEKGPATYGVVKKLRDNDLELHTDRQVLG